VTSFFNTLAIDTTESRGSVAFLRDGETIALTAHKGSADYSGWLLPAVEEVLERAASRMEDVNLLAVATGPGSFTGLRVGLTTVKAWAEVYGTPVVGVSRLEAMAYRRAGEVASGFLAVFYDAQRGQLFGALYRSDGGQLVRVEDERVIPPAEFVKWVAEQTGEQPVTWISLDPELLTSLESWGERSAIGDKVVPCVPNLAAAIGRLAEERARCGMFSDPLALDANYVRRSDAEIFWKGR